jgi:hypothetical protein
VLQNQQKVKTLLSTLWLGSLSLEATKEVTIHKCPNDNRPHCIQALAKLNKAEKKLMKKKSSPFKINYQSREYHSTNLQNMKIFMILKTAVDLSKMV